MSGCLVSARRSSAGSLLILALVACGGGGGDKGATAPPPPPAPLPQPGAVGATGQTSMVAIAGGTTPVAVRVTTVGGVPVPNVVVAFAAGAGSVAPSTVNTGSDGVASATWTLGTSAGTQTLTATAASLPAVSFTATVGAAAAASLSPSAGMSQTGQVGRTLPVAPAVTVRDQYGNIVSGAPVTFTIGAGGGSLEGAASVTSITDATGVATSAPWTLGFASTTQTLLASVASLAPVAFTASATSHWQVSRGSTLTTATIFASEPGFADSQNVPWSATRLGSPPLLALTCFDDGSVWLSLFHNRLVTRDGLVIHGFDDAAPTTSVWQENAPTFNMLAMTSTTSVRALIPRFIAATKFRIAFAEYLGSTYVATFDVRGLALVLPQLMAHCQ